MSELPKGWTEVTIGDIIELKYGKALPKKSRRSGPVQVLGSSGEVDRHNAPLLEQPTLVIGRKGSIGTVFKTTGPSWPIDTTYFVRHDPAVTDLTWLYYRLKAVGLSGMNKSVAIPGLNREDAYRVKIPLPPLEEQRRIATILDRASDMQRTTDRGTAALKKLESSIFSHMFGHPLRNPHGFTTAPLAQLVNIYGGGTPTKDETRYWSGEVPWFSAKDFKRSVLSSTHTTISEVVFAETSLRLLPPGTPLVVVRGMILNHSVPVAQLGASAAINQDVKAFLPAKHTERIDQDFLTGYLRAVEPYLLSQVTRAASGTGRLETRHLKELPIPRPGHEAETTYARRIARVRAEEKKHQDRARQLRRLTESLQSRAFRGEL